MGNFCNSIKSKYAPFVTKVIQLNNGRPMDVTSFKYGWLGHFNPPYYGAPCSRLFCEMNPDISNDDKERKLNQYLVSKTKAWIEVGLMTR